MTIYNAPVVDISHIAIYIVVFFQAGDLLNLDSAEALQKVYTLLLDKGTYDAISLSPDNAKAKRLTYLQNIRKLLPCGGHCLITSCNWTSEELMSHFTESGKFKMKEEVPVKQFQYGGKVGQTVCCLIFEAIQGQADSFWSVSILQCTHYF